MKKPAKSGLQTVNKKCSATAYTEENEKQALLDKVMPFEN